MKRIAKILSVILAAVIVVLAINPSLIFADVYNGVGTDTKSSSWPNGISYTRSGYLIYPVTPTGGKVKGAYSVLINVEGLQQGKSLAADRNGYYGECKKFFDAPAGMPYPFKFSGSGFASTAGELDAWMNENSSLPADENGNIPSKAAAIIKNYWGDEMLAKYQQREIVLMCEQAVCIKYGYTVTIDKYFTTLKGRFDLQRYFKDHGFSASFFNSNIYPKISTYGNIEAYNAVTDWLTGTPYNLDTYYSVNKISSKQNDVSHISGNFEIPVSSGGTKRLYTKARGGNMGGNQGFGGLTETLKLDLSRSDLLPTGGYTNGTSYARSGAKGICSIYYRGDIVIPSITPTPIPEVETDIVANPPDPIYETKHNSNIFDISKAIPSNEKVTNYVRASAWTGDIGLFESGGNNYITVTKLYSIPANYTAYYISGYNQETEWFDGSCGGIGGCTRTDKHSHTHQGEPIYSPVTVPYTFTYSAEVYYQAICDIDIRKIDSILVENEAFPMCEIEYEKKDLSNVNVQAKVINYGSGLIATNGSVVTSGMLTSGDDAHVIWASGLSAGETLGNYSSQSDATAAINAKIAADDERLKQTIGSNTQSWNDLVQINDNGNVLKFVDDTHVNGVVINGVTYGNTPAGKNENYTYGHGTIHSTMPDYITDEKTAFAVANETVVIPIDTQNEDFPTGLVANYVGVFKDDEYEYSAGYNFGHEDHIYDHVMEGGVLSEHNGDDPVDGYPIRVHTPVISPFSITFNDLSDAVENTQLVDAAYKP